MSEREKFEAWAVTESFEIEWDDRYERYAWSSTQFAYYGWLASLQRSKAE